MSDDSTAFAGAVSPVGMAADPVLPALARATRRQGLGSLTLRLESIWTWLAGDLAQLEQALSAVGDGQADLGWHSARYLLARPGKRIRPVCLALAARAGGRGFDEPVRDAAVACELVHAATLLHDDVVDEGDLRRGAPAARRVYGNSASVLGGDHLLVDALLRVDAALPAMRPALLQTIATMVRGEALQLERRNRFEPDRDMYLAIVRGKTASLFRWALRAGAALSGLDSGPDSPLARYGDALGVAFQLVDDALDLSGDAATTGKSACQDLREGKLTWPLLIASERCSDTAARLRHAASSQADIDPDVAAQLADRIRETGALEATRQQARRYAGIAREALVGVPAGRAREALTTVVDAALTRSH